MVPVDDSPVTATTTVRSRYADDFETWRRDIQSDGFGCVGLKLRLDDDEDVQQILMNDRMKFRRLIYRRSCVDQANVQAPHCTLMTTQTTWLMFARRTGFGSLEKCSINQ